jgi:hypothetical protein
MSDLNKSNFMMTGSLEHIVSTLMYCKGNIRMGVATEVEQHVVSSRIIEGIRSQCLL